uniref:Uncharacterized protein n=1 Tax=Glossina pallidipes TaxID=7398 RepID=A0A1A9ZHJ8_GLOPL
MHTVLDAVVIASCVMSERLEKKRYSVETEPFYLEEAKTRSRSAIRPVRNLFILFGYLQLTLGFLTVAFDEAGVNLRNNEAIGRYLLKLPFLIVDYVPLSYHSFGGDMPAW